MDPDFIFLGVGRREKDREEVEARRAMPETLRMKEDMERAQKTRDEKKKGSQGMSRSEIVFFFLFSFSRSVADLSVTDVDFLPVFLQKYHHKGAFYTVCLFLLFLLSFLLSKIENPDHLPPVSGKRSPQKARLHRTDHFDEPKR